MKKKILLFTSIFLVTLILTGCWNSAELNTLGITTVIGMDLVDGKILVTVEVINPRAAKEMSGAKSGELVTYVQGRGDTIFNAIRNISLKFDRKIFLSHNKIFIFGEEFAKRGLIDYIDILQRDHEFRETAYMLVVKGKKAIDVMGIYGGVEEIPGIYLEDIIESKKFSSKSVDVNISEYLKYYYDYGKQPILGVIDRKKKDSINKLEASKSKPEYEVVLEGCALFNKEKLVGYLTGEETKALNFVTNYIEGGVVEFVTPVDKVDNYSTSTPKAESLSKTTSVKEQEKSILEIIRSNTKNNVYMKNGKIILNTKVKIRGMLGEIIGDIDVSEEGAIKQMEMACSKQVKKEIEHTIKKVQKEYKVDVFGFGSLMHRKYPKEWHSIKDDWDNIFSEADVQVDIETNIIRTGLINTPITKVKGEKYERKY